MRLFFFFGKYYYFFFFCLKAIYGNCKNTIKINCRILYFTKKNEKGLQCLIKREKAIKIF